MKLLAFIGSILLFLTVPNPSQAQMGFGIGLAKGSKHKKKSRTTSEMQKDVAHQLLMRKFLDAGKIHEYESSKVAGLSQDNLEMLFSEFTPAFLHSAETDYLANGLGKIQKRHQDFLKNNKDRSTTIILGSFLPALDHSRVHSTRFTAYVQYVSDNPNQKTINGPDLFTIACEVTWENGDKTDHSKAKAKLGLCKIDSITSI